MSIDITTQNQKKELISYNHFLNLEKSCFMNKNEDVI